MCGIAGIIGFKGYRFNDDDIIKMNSFMKERGPDDEGYWHENSVNLAHKRLSIVDLSPLGRQPMEDVNKQCVITFNGEIYNFKELREELLKLKAEFRSNSDTEVLLQGYLHWGIESLLKRIDGMFAFVLYDKKKKIAYTCRDRFGQKPLYYYSNKNYVKFSSDIRSISKTEHNLTLDYESIDYYLTELSVPQPKTIWKEIKQVPPSNYLEINLETREIVESEYWRIDFSKKIDISLQEAEELVETELTKAVVRRIHGDVPIGSFLSGGVDSGLVTALLAINSPEKIKTFTVGLTYEEYDEAKLAKQLAERYETDHTEIILEPKDLIAVIDKLIDYCGEPFADSSLIPSFYICEAISDKIKVALSGDGGDEFFGGYYDYAYAFQTDEYLNKSSQKSAVTQSIGLLANKTAFRFGLTPFNQGIAVDYANYSGAEKLHRKMGFSFEEKSRLYTKQFSDLYGDFAFNYLQRVWDNSNKVSITDTLMEASLKTRLLNDYLVKVDRASMLNSLEVRSPFLDHKLAETSAKISTSYHLHNGETKYLTKKLARKYIDENIFSRRKQGFGIPLKEWLRKDLYEYVKEVIYNFDLVKKDIVRKSYVTDIFEQHRNGTADHTNKIWALFCLEKWLQNN